MREINTVEKFCNVVEIPTAEREVARRVLAALGAKSAKGRGVFTGAEVRAIVADAAQATEAAK